MTDYVANQSGSAEVATNFTPNGVPGDGDTIDCNGFNITNLPAILGDDSATPAITQNGGSITLSRNVQFKSQTSGINNVGGGNIIQAGFDMDIYSLIGSPVLVDFNRLTAGNTDWTNAATTGQLTATVGFTAQLFAKPSSATWQLRILWDAMSIDASWGNALVTNATAGNHILSGTDSWVWKPISADLSGLIIMNGRLDVRMESTTCTLDWRITALNPNNVVYGWDPGNHPIEFSAAGAPTGGAIRSLVGSIFQTGSRDHRFMSPVEYCNGPFDMTDVAFINAHCSASNQAHDMTRLLSLGTETGNHNNFILRGNHLADDTVTLRIGTSNPHEPSLEFTGTKSGGICDGLGFVPFSGEVGDIPVQPGHHATLNNWLFVSGAGYINVGLNATSAISLMNPTFDQAAGITYYESAGSATSIRSIKNVIASRMFKGMLIGDIGGGGLLQTQDDVNYVAFNPTEMEATNGDHPSLATTEGYVDDLAVVDNYGVNDQTVANDAAFGFADNARNALTWCATFAGYTNTVASLVDLLLARYGWTITGGTVATQANATAINYRAYMTAGFTTNNAAFDAAGEGGVDLGAFPIVVDIIAPNLTTPGATGITQTTTVLVATTDEANGQAHAILVPQGEAATPTNQEVIDASYANTLFTANDFTVTATGQFQFVEIPGLTPNTNYDYVIVHEDAEGNDDAGSRVEGSFSTLSATATFTIAGVPANQTNINFCLELGNDPATNTFLKRGLGETIDSDLMVVDLNDVSGYTHGQAIQGYSKNNDGSIGIALETTVDIS